MIIVLKPEASPDHAEAILARIAAAGLKPLHMPGSERVVLGALGDERILAELRLEGDPMVESVKPILAPYKLVSRELHAHDTIVRIGGASFGGGRFGLIAGQKYKFLDVFYRNTSSTHSSVIGFIKHLALLHDFLHKKSRSGPDAVRRIPACAPANPTGTSA